MSKFNKYYLSLINNRYCAILLYLFAIFYLLESKIIYDYFVPQDLSKYIGLFRDWVITLDDTYCEIKQDNYNCRPYQYGPILLYLPFPNILKSFYYEIFPITTIIIFILFIFLIFKNFYNKNKLLILTIIFSPTTLLVLERGNLDLHLFLIAITISYSRYYYLNIFLISISFLLKYYPITYLVNIFTFYKKKSHLSLWLTIIILSLFFGIFLFIYKSIFLDLFLNLSASKAGYHLIFSIKALSKIFKYYFSLNYILILLLTYLLFIFLVYRFIIFNYKIKLHKEINLYSLEEKLFLIGTNTSLFTYIIFSNIYYREIFLILSIPLIMKLRENIKFKKLFSFILLIIMLRYIFLHVHNFELLSDNHHHINDVRIFTKSFMITLTIKSLFDYFFLIFITSLVFFQNLKIIKILLKKN